MRRVLVTRPQPGAQRTAARLHELGFEPLVLPLSGTAPLPVDISAVPGNAAAVAVTSASALRHAPPGLIGRLSALPWHAVGERTAAAARQAGLNPAVGPGGALGLADAIAPGLAGKLLVYLCGRERFAAFEERLAAAGVQVAVLETYDTVALGPSDETVLSLLAGRQVDAILLHSAMAAREAARLGARGALAAPLAGAQVYALSDRVARAYEAAGGRHGRVRVAHRPDEDALLALLPAKD